MENQLNAEKSRKTFNSPCNCTESLTLQIVMNKHDVQSKVKFRDQKEGDWACQTENFVYWQQYNTYYIRDIISFFILLIYVAVVSAPVHKTTF